MRTRRFPVDDRHASRIAVAVACYASQSHTDAIAALSRDVRLTPEDLNFAIGLLGRIRFHAQSVMSAEDLSSFLELYEASGGVVDSGLFISYVNALAIVVAHVRRPAEGKTPSGSRADKRVILSRIRDTLQVLVHELLPRYPAVSRAAVSLALLHLHLHLPHRGDDIARCWAEISRGPPLLRSRASAVIVRFPLSAVYLLWEDLLTTDTYVPSPADWEYFERALHRGGTYAEAVRAVFERFCADPGLRSAEPAEESVKALLEHVTLAEARVRGILKYLQRAHASLPFQFDPVTSPPL